LLPFFQIGDHPEVEPDPDQPEGSDDENVDNLLPQEKV
jgi:hypothetical protein